MRDLEMQGLHPRSAEGLGQLPQHLRADPASTHAGADEKLVNEPIHAAELDGPAEGDDDIPDWRAARSDQVDRAMGRAVKQGLDRGAAGVLVKVDAFFGVKGGDQRDQAIEIFCLGKIECGHRRASLSVRRSKKPSASTLPMKVALAGRSVTRHQSATVMPRVNSEVVSISTLMCRPEKRSGRIR